MELRAGEWVQTEVGELGRIVHIARLTAFVQLHEPPQPHDIKACLASTVTKVEPPAYAAEQSDAR
ncbi:MAG: hypothetical protein U0805_21330 [Pirellulales bacterium]